MNLKRTAPEGRWVPWTRRGGLRWWLAPIFLVCLSLLALVSFVERESWKTWLEDSRTDLEGKIHSWGARPEHLAIDIGKMEMDKLMFLRDEALKLGVNVSGSKEFPAKVRYASQVFDADVSLKGRLPDHWVDEDTVSLKLELKEGAIMGMRRFSIQRPETRRFMSELIFHELSRASGVIGLRYRFITVTVNGGNRHVYALEERFGKRLLEWNRRREGPILHFQTQPSWENMARPAAPLKETLWWAEIESQGKLEPGSEQARLFDQAKALLEGFRAGELSPDQVFDVEKLAAFMALSDLIGHHHVPMLTNLRFYFNPITSKLEPVAYDASAMALLHEQQLLGTEKLIGPTISYQKKRPYHRTAWLESLFSDRGFFEAYMTELHRVSDPKWLEAFFSERAEMFDQQLKILHLDYPRYQNQDRKVLEFNQRYIRRYLNPRRPVARARWSADGRSILIDNSYDLPLELVDYEGQLVQAIDRTSPPSLATVVPAASRESVKEIRYRILGCKEIYKVPVGPAVEQRRADPVRKPPTFGQFGFVETDEQAKTIKIGPGRYLIDKDLIFPKGYRVVITSGTTLEFAESAMMLSYSPVDMRGTEEAPILLRGLGAASGGVAVLDSDGASLWEHVIVAGLGIPKDRDWSLSGAITFYESPIRIDNCRFSSNHSGDDLVNLVRTKFELVNSQFEDALADAVDIDFGDGVVSGCSFLRPGNDGLDVSGTRLHLRESTFDSAKDKGLSVGEASQVTLYDLVLKNCQLALASKDSSSVVGEKIRVEGCPVEFAVFQKKPEFSGGSVDIQLYSGSGGKLLVEKGSSLTLDGASVLAGESDLSSKLYDD